ncbi:lysozyme [Photorhabdus sp. APURE]|uniref:lysozyme n=1 Tax=Photorhabdus aballayi TaxID=2991723 RepID=UPI00223CB828|nr:lysozyme [Photorhabdus aballayi]MCW7550917.1 lysozyme [Photorhabdus aballayi]
MQDTKTKLSRAVIGLILGGASSTAILSQFLDEKEGNRLNAYQDAGGIWTICRGITHIDGQPVKKGMKLTATHCEQLNQIEAGKAIEWVKHNIHIPLTEPQIAGIASFCPYNIGPAKCFSSTFYRKLNSGDKKGACTEIKRWTYDKGRDCRQTNGQPTGCYGQIYRRDQESELVCLGLNK